MKHISKSSVFIIITIAVFFFSGCTSSKVLQSDIIEDQITIDGNQKEWVGKLRVFEDEKIAVAFRNDKENLYLCIVSADRDVIRKIVRNGMAITLTPNSVRHDLKIKYPLSPLIKFKDERPDINKVNPPDQNETKLDQFIKEQNELILLDGSGEEIATIPTQDSKNFDAKLGFTNNQFVYELKVPLNDNKTSDIKFDAKAGDFIAVKIETNDPRNEFEKMRKERMTDDRPDKPDGGQPPFGGGRGKGGGRNMKGNPDQMKQMMEPVVIECEVQLTK